MRAMKTKLLASLIASALAAVACERATAADTKHDATSHASESEVRGEYACPMHAEVRSEKPGQRCPKCGMELVKAEEEDTRAEAPPATIVEPPPPARPDETEQASGFSRAPIRLDAKQRQAIGLRWGAAERRSIDKVIRTVGRVDWDERKLAEVTLKFSGWIKQLHVDATGQKVQKGQPLFTIYGPDLVSAEQEYLLARRTAERLRKSSVPDALESATALVSASRERLRLWDLTPQQIRALEESGKPSYERTIHSPIAGVIIEKNVYAGSRVDPDKTLYRIGDLSTVWIYADVYESEVPFVREGQTANVTLPYMPGKEFTAKVAYVYPTLDPKSRTVRVRLELPNSGEVALRPEMFGKVELRVPLGQRLVVPTGAILDSGTKQVVFVDAGDGTIAPRDVRIGARLGDVVEITDGLSTGERIVASGNFLVDSESKLQGAESMMGMMGAIGMGDWKMESARPMEMGGGETAGAEHGEPQASRTPSAAAPAKDRRVGDLLVAVYAARGTARVGAAPVHVRVRDAQGNPVTDAEVSFSYTMDMPGMTIEQAKAKPVGDGVYEAMANFTMGGPWGLVVEIARPGKAPIREKFTVRVS